MGRRRRPLPQGFDDLFRAPVPVPIVAMKYIPVCRAPTLKAAEGLVLWVRNRGHYVDFILDWETPKDDKEASPEVTVHCADQYEHPKKVLEIMVDWNLRVPGNKFEDLITEDPKNE